MTAPHLGTPQPPFTRAGFPDLRWSVPDLQWAFQQPTTGFFVLTNTRSLSDADAAERNRGEIENRYLRHRHGDRDRGRPLVPRAMARTTAVLIAEAAGLGAHDDSGAVTVLSPDTQERTTT
jgi:hypothetical protein